MPGQSGWSNRGLRYFPLRRRTYHSFKMYVNANYRKRSHNNIITKLYQTYTHNTMYSLYMQASCFFNGIMLTDCFILLKVNWSPQCCENYFCDKNFHYDGIFPLKLYDYFEARIFVNRFTFYYEICIDNSSLESCIKLTSLPLILKNRLLKKNANHNFLVI